MRIGKEFILAFFIIFALTIVANIITPFFSFQGWLLLLLVLEILFLIFLLLRKRMDIYKLGGVLLGLAVIAVLVYGLLAYNNYTEEQARIAAEEEAARIAALYDGFVWLDVGSAQEENEFFSNLQGEMSEKKARILDNGSVETYRDINGPVSFDVSVPPFWDSMELALVGDVPDEFTLNIGGKELPIWTGLKDYEFIEQDGVYLYYLNPDAPKYDSVEDFVFNLPEDYTVGYTNNLIRNHGNDLPIWTPGEFHYEGALRGSHTFYIYAKGDLNVSFIKRDLNWYNGSDELNISLTDRLGNVYYNEIIPDDGSAINDRLDSPQNVSFGVVDLEENLYVLNLEHMNRGADLYIENLSVNQRYVVMNAALFIDGFNIYGTNIDGLSMRTFHGNDNRSILINEEEYQINKNRRVELNDYFETLRVVDMNGDTTVDMKGYFSIDKDNYFELKGENIQEVVSVSVNPDYFLTTYAVDDTFITLSNIDIELSKNMMLTVPFAGELQKVGVRFNEP